MEVKAKDDNKLFSKLFIITLVIISALMVVAIFIFSNNQQLYNNLFAILFSIVIFCLFFITFGIIILFFSKDNKKSSPLILKWMKLSFKLSYPLIYSTGRFIGIEKDRIRGIYAQINNYLVGKESLKVSADEILLLTPHCIQWAQCPRKITNDINNCTRCGKCTVKGLIEISEKYGTNLAIVTGGTLARRTIVNKRPKAIVAVACERDLTSGIQDVKNLPVLGVVNERPEGPCYNTRVDMSKVEEAILYFMKGE